MQNQEYQIKNLKETKPKQNMAINQDLQVIGTLISPFVQRVVWVLKMKGIEHEFIEENLMDKSALLLKYNPVIKKIPVLVHCGKPVVESLVIIEYIDEVWKQNPILPQDPFERSVARFWARFIDEKINDPLRRILYAHVEDQAKEEKLASEALDKIEEHLEKGNKKYFGGEVIGLADIALGALVIGMPVIDEILGKKFVDPNKYPCLIKWVENFAEIPIVKEMLPPSDEMVRGFLMLRPHLTRLPRS